MIATPSTIADVAATIPTRPRWQVRGAGTKTGLSGRDDGRAVLDLRALAGVVDYVPEECTCTALGGTRLTDLAAMLAAHGHWMPFDPPLVAAGATIGGTVAAGVNGSNRLRFGGVRDFILGARVVDGRGHVTHAGGRVVKNAAGFLLHQALVGSCGRLGVIAEVTFKVFPAAQACATLSADVEDLAAAIALVTTLQRARFDLLAVDIEAPRRVVARIGGFRESRDARGEALRSMLGRSAVVHHGDDDAATWQAVREFAWVPAGQALVRIPTTLPGIALLDARVARDATRRYTVAGNLALVSWPGPLEALDVILRDTGLTGQVLLGPADRPFLGRPIDNEFAARVRAVLDPDGRF